MVPRNNKHMITISYLGWQKMQTRDKIHTRPIRILDACCQDRACLIVQALFLPKLSLGLTRVLNCGTMYTE